MHEAFGRSSGSGWTGASPGSGSTSRRACTRTRSSATTRRSPGKTRWPAGSGSHRCTASTGRRRTTCTATGGDRGQLPLPAPAARRDLGGGPRLARRYYGDNDELQLTFNFPFVFTPFGRGPGRGGGRDAGQAPARACPVWTASNHDISRFPTRWCDGDERKVRLALLVLATLPGTTVLYYGDEIGMTDVDVPAELHQDKMRAGRAASSTGTGRHRCPGTRRHRRVHPPGVTPWLPLGERRRQRGHGAHRPGVHPEPVP